MTKIHSYCSYYNPCSPKHIKAPLHFQKLDSGKKCLVILATIFAAIGTFFMGGLGGVATFRHLVYKWSKMKKHTTSKTYKTGTNRLSSQKNEAVTVKNEISIQEVEKAQAALKDYFKKKTDNTLNISFHNHSSDEDDNYQYAVEYPANYDQKDLVVDFLIRSLFQPVTLSYNLIDLSSFSKGIKNRSKTFGNVSPTMTIKDFLQNCNQENLGSLAVILLKDSDKFTDYFESIDAFYQNLLKAQKYLYCLLETQTEAVDISIDPFKIKEVIEYLDKEMKNVIEIHNEDNINAKKIPVITQKIKEIRNMVFCLTYPLKLFMELYEQFAELGKKIHDTTLIPLDVSNLIAEYHGNDTSSITAYRDLLVKKWIEENSKSFIYQF